MNYKLLKRLFLLFFLSLVTNFAHANYPTGSPVALNGRLKVVGTQMVNECGNPVQLRGMSTHGPQWFGNCICSESLDVLVNDWGISLFRLAMYVEEGGYVKNPSQWRSWIDQYVDECEKRGIYCLIDWHVLNPGNPNSNLSAAKEFWDYMSKKHGSKKHVLYEICNEPNGVDWSVVKNYAEAVIPVIRANDKETIIIVGTPTWSQDVDKASQNKLSGDNIMYTLHFYAGSHGQYLRDKGETALRNGIALFVTEFGTSHASGDANYSPEETRTWVKWMNERKISWACWSYADKNEVSSSLVSGSCNSRNWNNTTASGTLIKGLLTENLIPFESCSSGENGGGNNGSQGGGNEEPEQPTEPEQPEEPSEPEEPEQPIIYPDLSQISAGNIYRIVNKNSGKVFVLGNGNNLQQVSLNDQAKDQLFIVSAAEEYYVFTNQQSSNVLSNLYNPNDGAPIVAEDLSNYDNPSQKWKLTKVDGNWYRIENKSTNSGNSCLQVENDARNDGANIVQATWANKDSQLWGAQFVQSADNTGIEDSKKTFMTLAPTMVEKSFVVIGEQYDSVELYSLAGVSVAQFGKEAEYDISALSGGCYFVEIKNGEQVVGRYKIVKK